MGEASFHRVAPVFVTTDLQRALEHYARLGFKVWRYEGNGYGYMRRGTVEIHLAEIDRGEPSTNTSCAYIWVDDADALYAEWSQSGAGGRFHPPTDTDYSLREGGHVDEDGNLLRFGSPL